MSLVKTDTQALVAVETNKCKGKEKQRMKMNVLDEEAYTKGIEEIITRDFYPDLPVMYSQAEYLEALEKNDLIKLREIQMKCREMSMMRPGTGASSVYNTPATFETPDASTRGQSPNSEAKSAECCESCPNDGEDTENVNFEERKNVGASLDEYLSKNTSEDNASFVEILKEGERRHREKHAWMYRKEDEQNKEHEKKLALPSIEEQAALEASGASVTTWKYTPNNAVMYVPDGSELSAQELIELKKFKPREIIHDNTRFLYNPHNMVKNKEMMHQAASYKALANIGKIGHDGKEILPTQSPRVNGYGFMATPSPAPGVDASPLMTWGEIESTPFRLDGNDTPLRGTPGPVFRIPDLPKRDKLAIQLAEKASKAHRAKKQEAIKQVTRNLASPSPKFGRSTSDRLNSMSPAAQRLVSKRLGIRTHTDKALRASYTPSPSHRLPGDKTPLLRLTPNTTPKSSLGTPGSSRGTPKREGSDVSSLTDNLLQLPKRQKAADFF